MTIHKTKAGTPHTPTTDSSQHAWSAKLSSVVTATLQVLGVFFLIGWFRGFISIHATQRVDVTVQSTIPLPNPPQCRPPLPVILLSSAQTSGPSFTAAAAALDAMLSERAAQPDIDALSVALVAPSGVVFEKHYGVLRANETASGVEPSTPNGKSLYRIASISKMFVVLELLVLREKGLLAWDDPVERFLPNFTYYQHSWSERLSLRGGHRTSTYRRTGSSITLRQLASHMSGIGRDYPPFDIKDWPNIDINSTNIKVLTTSRSKILDCIASLPLIAPQYTNPSYSNAGFNVLGWAITAAANKTSTYADLLHADIFTPLGLSSTFNVTVDNVANIVVPLIAAHEADMDFTDADNAAGGQFSSLSDLATVMQTFLDPSRSNSLLPQVVTREWLRPIHGFPDDLTEIGAPWEIKKLANSFGSSRRLFAKGGNLQAYHANFVMDPSSAYGAIVLMTGRYHDAAYIATQVIQTFQAAFDSRITEIASTRYDGFWVSEDEMSTAVTYMENGSLWINQLLLNGNDVFEVFEGPRYPSHRRYGLWTTGRDEEFRIAFGSPGSSDKPLAGCQPFWVSMDSLYSRGAPIDLVIFEGDEDKRRIRVPSVDVALLRVPS